MSVLSANYVTDNAGPIRLSQCYGVHYSMFTMAHAHSSHRLFEVEWLDSVNVKCEVY